jgi:hypothetical protein
VSTTDYEAIDLAQQVMDGKKEPAGARMPIKSGGNRSAEMMAGMRPEVCALLWALVRSTDAGDRHFALLHLMLTNEMRGFITASGVKFTKQSIKAVAKGVARSATHQHLYNKGPCKNCKGTGFVRVYGRENYCSTCGGTAAGRWSASDAYRLAQLDITRQSYQETCARFETHATQLLGDWRAALDEHLHKYFKANQIEDGGIYAFHL